MVTLKADNRRRVQLPNAKPGQVFAFQDNGDGSVKLTLVKPVEPLPGKVKFVKKNGYTVGVTDRNVSLETIRELLAEFP